MVPAIRRDVRTVGDGTTLRPWPRLAFNLDGLLAFSPTAGGPDMAYLQLFRSGAIETVTSALHDPERQVLWSAVLGRERFALLRRAELLLTTLGLEPPVSMFMSLLGMRDVTLFRRPGPALHSAATPVRP